MSAYVLEGRASVTALELKVSPEFRDLLPPLTDEQQKELSDSIDESGIYSPVVGWNDGKTWWLADGNNRMGELREILKSHPSFTEPDVVELKADSPEEVKAWIIKEHIGRRNLTPVQISELRGRVYNSIKREKTENLPKGQNDPLAKQGENEEKRTSEAVAETFGVSEKTIRRDADFAKGIEKLPPEEAKAVRAGKSSKTKKEVEAIGRDEQPAPKPEAKTEPEQNVKELCKPFNGLVKKVGEVINEFGRMKDQPGGEFIDSIAIQEMKTKGGNLQEVIKARRPVIHKACEGKGCKACNNLGYVKG
jgi:hypothetical protein